MGLFGNSASIEQAIDANTDGKRTTEDWQEILEIVDQIEQQPNGAKEALKAIMKRVKNKDPHVAMLALTLLDACVANAKRKFHLEVSSRTFDEEVRGMFKNNNNFNREILERLAQLIKKWSENEFRSDPALTLIPSLWTHIKTTRPNFTEGPIITGKAVSSTSGQPLTAAPKNTDSAAIQRKEEEDFAKAIALSLEDENKKKRSASASNLASNSASLANSNSFNQSSSALYPSVSTTNNNAIYASVRKEPKETRRVRAMYDFEAVEDNELTFKAGEILHVIDDSDPNWWKGSNSRGEGLFPTNFVTSDLNWEAENEYATNSKKKTNDEVASLTSADPAVPDLKPVTIDEALIDQTLNMIHDADPEGERPDPVDLLELEDRCSRMWPLIDAELQKTDKLQSSLEEISNQINDALAMYDTVMKEQSAQMPTMPYQVPVDHSLPPGHYQQGVAGPPGPQFPQAPAMYQNYQEQHAGYAPTGYGPPVVPMGMPQPTGFQPYGTHPHPGKLAAAQGASQFLPPQSGNYSGQPQQGPYQSYPPQ